MDWLKKMINQVAIYWGKWSLVQRVILLGIVAAVMVATAVLLTVSSTPNMVPVIDAPIRDEYARDRIVMRLNEEGVRATVSPTGVVQV